MADLRLLALTHLLAAGAGFAVAPRELLETEVVHNGFFQTDTKRVLAAAVESLRSENKLLVYSYKGFAAVSVKRDGFLFLDGHQDLIVPAGVGYYLDLSRLTAERVAFDEASRVLTIHLPTLVMGDVAFEPEGARTSNGGLLTLDQDVVDELSRLNYASARKAFIAQAQQASLVDTARLRARETVERHFQIPLNATGNGQVRVVATFAPKG